MTVERATVFTVLAGAMALFIWGRWRYDVVAVPMIMWVWLP